MAGHRDAIGGQQQIGLNEIGALPNGKAIGLHRVFGHVFAGTSMGDHQRALSGRLGRCVAGKRGYQSQGETEEMRRHGAFYALFRSLALLGA